MKFRKGDKVSAVGVVGYTYEGQTHFPVRFGEASEVHLKAEELTLDERKFEVGEKVTMDDDRGQVWDIVGADGDWLWLRDTDNTGERMSVEAAECELFDPDFAEVEAPLPPPDPPRSGLDDEGSISLPKTVTVRHGDNLSTLALIHGTGAIDIANLNGIELTAPLEVGQVLELPR